jgi:hypothetical protein
MMQCNKLEAPRLRKEEGNLHAVCRVAFFDDDSVLSGALERHIPTEFYMRFVRQVAERGDSRGQAL